MMSEQFINCYRRSTATFHCSKWTPNVTQMSQWD